MKSGIVPEDLRLLHPQFGCSDTHAQLPFIAFHGATIESQSSLVWTVQSILPTIPKSNVRSIHNVLEVMEKMGACIKAEPRIVAKHTYKLCTSLSSNSKKSQQNSLLVKHFPIVHKVMIKIYKYFSANLTQSNVDNSLLNMLRDASMVLIPDFSCLVKSKQLASDIREEDQIIPYLFRLPLDLGPYNDLFIRLGATKQITFEQYADVLKRISLDAKDQEMDPNSRSLALKALTGLFALIDCKKVPATVTELFIPCVDGKLHLSSEVVIKDNSWLDRIPNFQRPIFIDSKEIGYSPVDSIMVFKNLPQQQQPKLLSSIIQEIVDPACGSAESSLAVDLCTRLKSQEFKSCFERLLQHCRQTTNRHVTDVSVNKIVEKLSCIQFLGKDKLKTCLMLENKKQENSEMEKRFFVDEIHFEIHIDADYLGGKRFDNALANVINKIADNILQGSAFQALPEILSSSPTRMNTILQEYDITELCSSGESFVPCPGENVPERFLDSLSQDIFSFSPEQIVALEIEDPLETGENGVPVYIIAKILEKINGGSSDITTKYRVKVSPTEERIVDVSILYAFLTSRMSDETEYLSIVLYEGPNLASDITDRPKENQTNLNEIITEMKRVLKIAWTLPAELRNRYIKRLCLRWHPDKNPDQIELSTEVFQILQILIGKLEKNEDIDENNVEGSDTRTDEESSHFNSNNFYGFSNFKDHMGERARQYRDRQRNSQQFQTNRQIYTQQLYKIQLQTKQQYKQH